MIVKKTLLYMFMSALSGLIVTSACSKPASEEIKTTVEVEDIPSIAALNIKVPLAGNAYITSGDGAAEINESGLANWSSQTAVASTYFRVSKK
ncbi:MAG: hypothetical protein ABW174_00850, partial [Flavitalea sp.]